MIDASVHWSDPGAVAEEHAYGTAVKSPPGSEASSSSMPLAQRGIMLPPPGSGCDATFPGHLPLSPAVPLRSFLFGVSVRCRAGESPPIGNLACGMRLQVCSIQPRQRSVPQD